MGVSNDQFVDNSPNYLAGRFSRPHPPGLKKKELDADHKTDSRRF